MDPQTPQTDPAPSKPPAAATDPPEGPDVFWILVGDRGLRSGWSALIFIALYYLFLPVLGTIAVTIAPFLAEDGFSPMKALLSECVPLLAIAAAALFLARVEHRHLADYHLGDSRWLSHLGEGVAAGFAALSGLVAALTLGGWMHFGRPVLSGALAVNLGLTWAAAFLVVGLFEEGSFRCYLQFTLARGITFWWALAAVAAACLAPQLRADLSGVSGVYIVAALGLLPCWLVHRSGRGNAGFWQAAWVTSTAFGAYHTGNAGETPVGIFAAALIGFVFCVSVRVTGSAWWAIGCHAAWDWAETYFYGTPDSGLIAQSHYFTTQATGNPWWSGGAVGPEGSLLAIPVIAALGAGLLVVYGAKPSASVIANAEPLAK